MIHLPYLHTLYSDYLAYFNGNRDFFECHEVLEEYWKDIAPGDKDHVLVGLVQLATGMYHWRRNNTIGALRILQKAQSNLKQQQTSPFLAVLDLNDLQQQIAHTLKAIQQQHPFKQFDIIIQDAHLQQAVQQKMAELTLPDAHYLHNKHMLRDRSELLITRAKKIAQKGAAP